MRRELRVSGGAAADVVWQRYLRPQLWSTWSPQILGVDCADDEIRIGTTGVVRAIAGVKVEFVVTAVDADSLTWSWTATLPFGIRMHLDHCVYAAPVGCNTGLVVDGPASVVLGYLPVARLALGRLVRADLPRGKR